MLRVEERGGLRYNLDLKELKGIFRHIKKISAIKKLPANSLTHMEVWNLCSPLMDWVSLLSALTDRMVGVMPPDF